MSDVTVTKIILRKGNSVDAANLNPPLERGEPALVARPGGYYDLYVGDGATIPGKILGSSEAFYGEERTEYPPKPTAGKWGMWMSNGTSDLGLNKGDIVVASTVNNVTRYRVIMSYNQTFTVWP